MSSFSALVCSAGNPCVDAHVVVHASGGIHVSHRTYMPRRERHLFLDLEPVAHRFKPPYMSTLVDWTCNHG